MPWSAVRHHVIVHSFKASELIENQSQNSEIISSGNQSYQLSSQIFPEFFIGKKSE